MASTHLNRVVEDESRLHQFGLAHGLKAERQQLAEGCHGRRVWDAGGGGGGDSLGEGGSGGGGVGAAIALSRGKEGGERYARCEEGGEGGAKNRNRVSGVKLKVGS
jgi:hypothetical protein